MRERGQSYEDTIAVITERFEASVASAERVIHEAGGRHFSATALNNLMAESIRCTVEETSDVDLLAVLASRPWLLHANPNFYGKQPTLRESMDLSLKVALYKDLADIRLARLGEGQDETTLPDIAETALAALSSAEATGARFQEAADTRSIFTAGDWDGELIYAVGIPLAEFLVNNGHAGVGNDLLAAIEARHVVAGRRPAPSPV